MHAFVKTHVGDEMRSYRLWCVRMLYLRRLFAKLMYAPAAVTRVLARIRLISLTKTKISMKPHQCCKNWQQSQQVAIFIYLFILLTDSEKLNKVGSSPWSNGLQANLENLTLYNCFLRAFFFCCSQSYDIKYSHIIRINCAQLYGFKYSNSISIIICFPGTNYNSL